MGNVIGGYLLCPCILGLYRLVWLTLTGFKVYDAIEFSLLEYAIGCACIAEVLVYES
jgi:hypothetical protein